jgi:hypothetical protein
MSSLVRYDAARRRLWIFGQRCHHGSAGALLAAFGLSAGSRAALAAGSVLMLHDWKDRSIWFELGAGTQP